MISVVCRCCFFLKFELLRYLISRSFRLPDGPDLFQQMDSQNFQNKTGFSGQLMLNLQRVLACLQVSKGEPDGKYLTLVSRISTFSKPLIMAMNAQSEWSPGSNIHPEGSEGLTVFHTHFRLLPSNYRR